MNEGQVTRVKVTGEERQTFWSRVNTILLIFLSIVGFFVVRWMNEVEGKLRDVVSDINEINRTISIIQADRQYERGREAGRKEVLEDNWIIPRKKEEEKR